MTSLPSETGLLVNVDDWRRASVLSHIAWHVADAPDTDQFFSIGSVLVSDRPLRPEIEDRQAFPIDGPGPSLTWARALEGEHFPWTPALPRLSHRAVPFMRLDGQYGVNVQLLAIAVAACPGASWTVTKAAVYPGDEDAWCLAGWIADVLVAIVAGLRLDA